MQKGNRYEADVLGAINPFGGYDNCGNTYRLRYTYEKEGLKFYLKFGATLVDVMGDTFAQTPGELTKISIAVDRQKNLSSGPYCRMHRIMGPYFSFCMWLCVDRYVTFSSREQLFSADGRCCTQT